MTDQERVGPKPSPGEGWRLLHLGEYIREGDEFLNPHGKEGWVKTADAGKVFGAKNTIIYRRRVTIPTPNDGWISAKDRLTTKEDGDELGYVGVFGKWSTTRQVIWSYDSVSRDTKATHWRKLPPPPPPPELSAKEKALKEWQGASKTSHEDVAWVAGWEACERAMKENRDVKPPNNHHEVRDNNAKKDQE